MKTVTVDFTGVLPDGTRASLKVSYDPDKDQSESVTFSIDDISGPTPRTYAIALHQQDVYKLAKIIPALTFK